MGSADIGKREKLAEPDYLCFVEAEGPVVWSKVSDWTEEKGRMTPTDYVFISYTARHFPTGKNSSEYLRSVGVHAARTVGVNAYWISDSCLCNLEMLARPIHNNRVSAGRLGVYSHGASATKTEYCSYRHEVPGIRATLAG